MRKLYEHYKPRETPPRPPDQNAPWIILGSGDILVPAQDPDIPAEVAKVLESLDARSLLDDIKRRVACVGRDIARLQDEINDIL